MCSNNLHITKDASKGDRPIIGRACFISFLKDGRDIGL